VRIYRDTKSISIPMSSRPKWLCRCGLVLMCWIGANWLALRAIELYESLRLETEHHVPAEVIRSYESRALAVRLNGPERDVSLPYRFRPPPWSAGLRSMPLVVILHGAGARGSDNVRQLRSLPVALCDDRMRSLHPCAVHRLRSRNGSRFLPGRLVPTGLPSGVYIPSRLTNDRQDVLVPSICGRSRWRHSN
jgi:hypothetical protein